MTLQEDHRWAERRRESAAAAAAPPRAAPNAHKSQKHHQTPACCAQVPSIDTPNHPCNSLAGRSAPWRAPSRAYPHPTLSAAKMDPDHLFIGAPGARLNPPFHIHFCCPNTGLQENQISRRPSRVPFSQFGPPRSDFMPHLSPPYVRRSCSRLRVPIGTYSCDTPQCMIFRDAV